MNLIEKAQKVMMFKEDIAKECKKRNLRMPTDEQISDYINGGYGMKLDAFMLDYIRREGVFRVCREVSPLEKAALEETLNTLSDEELVTLWNVWREEIGVENDSIFDLNDLSDRTFITQHFNTHIISKVNKLMLGDGFRFVRIIDNNIVIGMSGIKNLFRGSWFDMFNRMLLYPECYDHDYKEGAPYFTTIIVPIMVKMLGYTIDQNTNDVTYNKGGE